MRACSAAGPSRVGAFEASFTPTSPSAAPAPRIAAPPAINENGSARPGPPDAAGPGGFTGVLQEHTYPKLYNLYLDPKESHNYLTRKLSYMEAFQLGIRQHLGTFRKFPPKTTMGLAAADPREG